MTYDNIKPKILVLAIVQAITFQPNNVPVPSGYIKDIGQAYNDTRGFGWVREDSLGNTIPTPLDIQLNTRDRNQSGIEQRLNRLIHLQYPANNSGTAVKIPAAWEYKLSNGSYNVNVSVGDPINTLNSKHQINIEGRAAISGFVPTATKKFTAVTRIVNVTDGKLTIDAKGGTNTKLNYIAIAPGNLPSVRTSNPTDGQTNVPPDMSITVDVNLPNSGIAVNTLSASTIKLIDSSTNTQVNANYNTSGGGDVIVVASINHLKSNTKYLLQITDGVKDSNGVAFLPYNISFTTGTKPPPLNNISFERISLPNVPTKPYTTVLIGPDNKLYAATLLGEILRFPINANGTLGTPQTISSLQTANGGNRTIIGMHFDPSSTNASNLILWVTNNHYWNGTGNAPEWSGKITRLSGSNLEKVQDYVVGLPRSSRDHLTNSIEFKPNEPNVLYVLQGSNSSTGAPNSAWNNRSEKLLTAAVLRVDLSKITSLPLSVKTEDGGTYNPFNQGAPVTIFASGVRNAYDLLWHTNGQLYVPTNGSAAGGNTPNTPIPLPHACQNRIDKATNGVYTSPSVPFLSSIGVQRDFLFRVVKNGYYGHPNPKRCEWVLNGGNPTAGTDPDQVNEYPIGTLPDRNWKGIAFDFGEHFSPNGIIEYRSNVLGGQLQGKLLVTRYSAGKDIIVLTPGGAKLDIVNFQTGITGFTGFDTSPLDLVENPTNGYIYVAQLSQETGMGKITLLRPLN
ncbi:Ig-like domain-containing protein [Nostoc flagelliforme FACHB-838]|uniref:Ig-like domain-containing protein n=1 Tax=Nostoc flagelliforme FACHB-838 TaxID=2692904 RepID=A0ABR8DGT0_9NOSO|nr:Ig-like domain-containing protein [Nostoc flagelliforme]MBD2528138.1 Ig-like domain-containing protein [Nostoc flagelliforme FACHB-838]